jgi:putative transposase
LSAGRVRATYEFIKAHRREYSVEAMCRVLEVAPSGYCDWLKQPVSKRAQEDARLLRLIGASFTASQGVYGAPRVFLDLREAGETCSKHRVARMMRLNGLRALHGYRTRQGWLYLAVVMDRFSRRIIGWSAGPTIHRELVLDAALMAVRRRRQRGTIIHSDQGTQFGSDAWRRFCRANHLEPSTSRKGNCWDNAVAESFFSSLKKERVKKHIYQTRELALADVSDYIESFYNPTRRHSHLGGMSPDQFEAAHKPRRRGVH